MDHLLNKDSGTILVVEDDVEAKEVLCTTLELEGYVVHTATNGFEAIDAARALKPDVILMDIIIPEMDGIEATRILKSDQVTRYIPNLIVTVVDKREDIVNGLTAGETDYITKPFFMPELTARVKAALTSRNHYEEKIEITERYRQLVENASEGILIIQDGMLRFCNLKTIEINGESALELYRNKPNEINLVILDLFMPGMGGMRCLEKLLNINPHARIIISSGYVVNGSTEKTIGERTRGYISKPFDREQILSLIREVLDVN